MVGQLLVVYYSRLGLRHNQQPFFFGRISEQSTATNDHRLSISTWNPKQPFINGCFNWMIQNLYMGNGCLTKHPLKTGCLEFQVCINKYGPMVLNVD